MLGTVSLVELFFCLGITLLAAFSCNIAILTLARFFRAPRALPSHTLPAEQLPRVLVQLPLFNEGALVERILDAVVALDWPSDRLEVQVLDDSIDGSLAISERAVAVLQAQGCNVRLLHRTDRTAFKAGALAAGLEHSAAPYIAIFDADFIPPPDFLQRTIGVLAAGPDLAFVQARWDHLNSDHSLLTRIQARLLDGHFRVEQEARWRLGLPVPFNGTCGVWRRAAITAAGGWQGDTLTEDLDLSLRARLAGWRSAYLLSLTVPGTLPESARAWRTQQFRWTKGFVQCFVKVLPLVWSSRRLPLWQKLAVTLQLGQPMAFMIGIACILLSLPLMTGIIVLNPLQTWLALSASLLGFVAPISFLWLARPGCSPQKTAFEVVGALVLTSGLLLSNARAGLEALLGYRSPFVRTPKLAVRSTGFRTSWRYGMTELLAGIGLLGFVLVEQPVAIIYLAMVIVGLLGFGLLQMLDGRVVSGGLLLRK